MTSTESAFVTRRGVLAGAAAAGVASALVACGGDSQTGSEPTQASGDGKGAGATVNVTDVPVGSAVIVGEVVVSQPAQGQFKAFSAACTHQGCLVSRVEAANIRCTCHDSAFSAADGSVVSGPATRSLAGRTVTVVGESLIIS